MANKAFETIVESFNAQLDVLNNNGYSIYDADNPDYFILRARYNGENDQIEFETVLDPNRKEEV
ncbi:hypothetical protein [Clostridium magnum]|uniref:Uncharacterized protein n=1 Tax=Clostridium magnum DSM 2767 TaxID=1121326 RepID=A0A161Y7G3_9CLOT|nr:hypothetical protein [Clostridium magnum]KZL94329.1 hypothetical protein CLMAG_13820 [Clostridium magnum DSM 2767]SHJ54795.1 hypothetical protein SAMN02745944_06139 [Clostridium magnum DSM 2767]